MHSLRGRRLAIVVGWLVAGVSGAVVPPSAVVTPAPVVGEVWDKRQAPDPISFAQLLLTAIPQSLRQIAATNAPAVSSILNEEFLDDKRPQWFLDLPYEIQSYLIKEFGPSTAWMPPAPTTKPGNQGQWTPTNVMWTWPTTTGSSQASQSTARSSGRSSSSARSSASMASRSGSFSTSVVSSTGSPSSKIESRSAASASSSSSGAPTAPAADNAGLTKQQKVGLGVGIPFGVIGAAALLFGCCFLLRRRRNRRDNGSVPPSSPGFIPRFAFQDKSTDNFEHRRPLNPPSNRSTHDLGSFDWEEDGVDPFEYDSNNTAYRGHALPPASPTSGVPQGVPMAMHDATPIMAPALYHTHSSNRARGKRTSYSSLQSVAEVSEPDETAESPVLGRHVASPLERKRRPSMPMVLEIPPTIAAVAGTEAAKQSIKRKPVPTSPVSANPAAELASQSLLRPTIPEHSGSSSSGLALSTNSSTYANPSSNDPTSPISPISDHHIPTKPANPFSNDYSYVEDYGPEYQSGYVDVNDGLYGGHTSLSRYPDPSPPRRGSKTEWPLRNISLGRKREKSPLWDRVYESP